MRRPRVVKTTKAQRQALKRKFDQLIDSYAERLKRGELRRMTVLSYKQFRKSVQPCFDGSGCIMVEWCGMWLGIEKDGYTHS
jgi:hypothetical protein